MVGLLLSYWGDVSFREGVPSRKLYVTWDPPEKEHENYHRLKLVPAIVGGYVFLVPWRVFPNISPSWNHFERPQIPKQAWITVAATEDGDVEEQKKRQQKTPQASLEKHVPYTSGGEYVWMTWVWVANVWDYDVFLLLRDLLLIIVCVCMFFHPSLQNWWMHSNLIWDDRSTDQPQFKMLNRIRSHSEWPIQGLSHPDAPTGDVITLSRSRLLQNCWKREPKARQNHLTEEIPNNHLGCLKSLSIMGIFTIY